MPKELAYVIVTPYSLHKSRTGGILTRLITRTGCELVSARMFAPSAELVKKYAEETISANDPQDRRIQVIKRLRHDGGRDFTGKTADVHCLTGDHASPGLADRLEHGLHV